MLVGSGHHQYDWIDNWAAMPDGERARAGWSHPGMAVTEAGEILTCHSGDPTILVFDADGNLLRSWDAGVADAHGITLVKDDGQERVWIADNGAKRQPGTGYEYPPGVNTVSGQVVKQTLEGETVMALELPALPAYQGSRCSPTSVAVNEQRHGGNGDVWVADGYGESYVHRYDRHGDYLSSIDGQEGAGRFNCPHGIFIDRRGAEPELYVSDRANGRVQVYDLDGGFKRSFGSDFLTTPSAFAVDGDLLVIAELRARLAVVDAGDNLVTYVGPNEAVCEVDGWPNNKDAQGNVVATRLLEPGKFNSPHGLATDADGNIYVAEWLIGGRLTKLAKV